MNNDLIFQMALARVPHIGPVHAKTLAEIFGAAEDVFKSSKSRLEKIDGIGKVRASSIKSFSDFKTCEKEIAFIVKHKISTIFINDEDYPKRLLNCHDSPLLLFYKGTASLNRKRFISIVGTRSNTDYGKSLCEKLIEGLIEHNVTVISGLAYGIDTIAHKTALKNNIETIGILAHGLDRIYPHSNRHVAMQMIDNGGLLTEYPSNTNPDKQHFPERNRITAGLCDALVVIETEKKGGSMITAEIANSYHRDVFAFPGNIHEPKSDGCHHLIKQNKACLITGVDDLLSMMNWIDTKPKKSTGQRALFINMNDEERKLLKIIEENPDMDIDMLTLKSDMSHSRIAVNLLSLEMNGLIMSLPGKRYRAL